MTDDFDPTQLDPDEREEIVAQIPVVSAAWRFIIPALRDDDLAAAWPAVDPCLRLCWAQVWLGLNRADAEAEGYDLGEVADALAEEAPTHPLWRQFSRVLLRDLHGVADLDPDAWGIGANARVLGVDIELLYLQDKTGLEGDMWRAGVERLVLPIVMRLHDDQWRVLNYGSETIPTPGWPPTLFD
jgi:hypothetical protein